MCLDKYKQEHSNSFLKQNVSCLKSTSRKKGDAKKAPGERACENLASDPGDGSPKDNLIRLAGRGMRPQLKRPGLASNNASSNERERVDAKDLRGGRSKLRFRHPGFHGGGAGKSTSSKQVLKIRNCHWKGDL